MSTNYPSSKDTSSTIPTQAGTDTLSNNHVVAHQNLADSVIAVETKLGIDSSADTTSIDYKLKSTSSLDPGHKHTPTVSLAITGTPDGTKFLRDDNTWQSPPTVSNASTSAKGVVQEATQAQVLSKTASGSTGAELYVNPSTLSDTLLSDGKADTGSANAYVITPSPAITAYTTYQIFSFKATNANTTASTLNVNGLGTKTIKKGAGAFDLASGDIASGMIVVVEYDGTNFVMLNSIAPYPQVRSRVFTAGGTWTQPSGVTKVNVRVIGAGGGGGGIGNTGTNWGGGGGAGGYAEANVTVSGNVTVTVGAGGAGGVGNATGTTGGASSFAGGVTVTANGGVGGGGANSSAVGAGGAGGTTTNGDLGITGASGLSGQVPSTTVTGAGGSSPLGIGGYGAIGAFNTGNNGNGYGSGGSGATGTGGAAQNGGAGAGGIVIVEWVI
jgi:hypothetical protein